MISQDAHVSDRTPFASEPELLDLRFGIFDDSFHLAWRPGYNLRGWQFFGMERFHLSPAGGEILLPDKERSDRVVANWGQATREFGITFLIAEQWLRWISVEELEALGMSCGYRFKVLTFETNGSQSRLTIENVGAAPIYYDARPAVNGVRARESLQYLLPGERRGFTVGAGGEEPRLSILCDRLVPGQVIGFEADIAGIEGSRP